MSTLYVDTINEKTSGNGVQIPGHVVQVLSVTTSNNNTSSSTSFVDVTNGNISITPSSSSNKIWIIVDFGTYYNSGATYPIIEFNLVRNSTSILTKQIAYQDARSVGTIFGQQLVRSTLNYLDSPTTTSAVTYKLQFRQASGGTGSSTMGVEQGVNLTVMEIAQ